MAATTTMIHPTACVDEGAQIGPGCQIWHYSHISSTCRLGANCMIGQGCYLAPGVQLGNGVRIQNQVALYTGLLIEDDVFIGPSCVFTNVKVPRAFRASPSGLAPTILRRGCSIGANATLLSNIEVGYFSLVGAGAVVTSHVPDFAIVLGTPARLHGYLSHAGHTLQQGQDPNAIRVCPETGLRYQLQHHHMRCLDLKPHEQLPSSLQRANHQPRQQAALPA